MKKIILILIGLTTVFTLLLSGCNELSDEISNKPPTVTINPSVREGYAPLSVDFTCIGNDTDGIIISYFWDFGDGSTSNEMSPTHVFQEKGKTYTVTLIVTDDKGANATDTITIEVKANRPPTASANADITEGLYPLSVTFTGSGNDDDGEIVSYQWDFKDGSTSDKQNPTHTFDIYGSYEVKLTVADDEGKTNTDTITIKVKIPIVTQQDNDLLVWIGESNDVLSPYISSITYAAANLMASSLDFWGDECWDDAYDYSNEIDQFTYLSPPFSEMKEKYRLILEDYKSIGVGAGILADYIYSYDTSLIEIRVEGLTNDLETLANRIEELTILVSLIESSTYVPPSPPEIIYSYAYSASWDTYVFGKIKNVASENIKDIGIKITLYDASDNVIKTETVSPHLSIIQSQGTSVFHKSIWTSYYDHYDIEVTSFKATNEQPYNGVQILSHSRNDFLGCPRVEGTIKNVGSKVASIDIYANFYDSSGNLIAVASDFEYLYSGEEGSFSATFWDDEDLPTAVSSYDLEIDCVV